MKSVVLIIPYFGKLPDYYKIWEMTALKNNTIDFLFFTDIDAITPKANIKVVKTSFDDFANLFSQKFDFTISLESPYKLCDFKPTYGYVLYEYIKEYEFWGHCDIDLLFGDIRAFITDDILNHYDKILELGHFTLYRNNLDNNSAFMNGVGFADIDYKKALSSKESMYFDEILGTMWIARKNKIKTFYSENTFFDVCVKEKKFFHITDFYNESIFYYDGKKLFAIDKVNNDIRKTEIMYAHFQKRAIDYSEYSDGVLSFYIVPNKLISVADDIDIKKLFIVKGQKLYSLYKKIEHVKMYLKKYNKKEYGSFLNYKRERTRFHNIMKNARDGLKDYKET